MKNDIQIKNKKAAYQYFLFDSFVAGIQLEGTEIKSIRMGKVNLSDAYCAFENEELYIKNLHISEYDFGTHYNHEPKRDRKLLLTKKELKKIRNKITEKGFSLIPTLLYINEKGYAKLDISIARGKKFYDKRNSIKDKDIKRDIDRKI